MEYLKENLVADIDTLLKFEVEFMDKDLENYLLYISNSAVKEVLHLVQRYTHPQSKKVKFDAGDFRKMLLSSSSETNESMN